MCISEYKENKPPMISEIIKEENKQRVNRKVMLYESSN